MKKLPIGIMQGRLSPMEGEAMQFFPKNNSMKEIGIVEDLGLEEVELVFDGADGYGHHILQSSETLGETLNAYHVKANSILADFFVKYPLRKDNAFILSDIIKNCRNIGATIVEVPFIENSKIHPSNRKEVIEALQSCFMIAGFCNVKIALETDLYPRQFRDLIDELSDAGGTEKFPLIGANFDAGNSAAAGHDPEQEIETLSDKIFNVHIKDRPLGGKTVPLGAGAVDFQKVLKSLDKVNYQGSLILQAARSVDGDEKKCVVGQIEFLKKHMELAWT